MLSPRPWSTTTSRTDCCPGRTGKNTAALTWPISPPSAPSVRETKALLHAAAEGEEDWALYAKFLGQMDMALERTADALDPDTPREELAGLALSLALRSYADQLACQRILDLIAPQEATKAERKRRVKEG